MHGYKCKINVSVFLCSVPLLSLESTVLENCLGVVQEGMGRNCDLAIVAYTRAINNYSDSSDGRNRRVENILSDIFYFNSEL